MSTLRKIGKKRAAQIAAGTWSPKPRKPLNKMSQKARRRVPLLEAWRAIFHARSGGVCEYCESAPAAHVHHLYEVSTYPELRLHPANGLHVCVPCHEACHKDLIYTRAWFARLIPEFRELYEATGEIKERP